MTKKEWFLIGGEYEDGGYFYDVPCGGYLTYEKLPKESTIEFINQLMNTVFQNGIKVGKLQRSNDIMCLLTNKD